MSEVKTEVQTVQSSSTGNQMTGGSDSDPLAAMNDVQREDWLLTGKLPSSEEKPAASAATTETVKPKESEGDGKTAESSTAAATAKSEGDEKKAAESSTAEPQKRRPTGAEARIAELSAETRALKERLAKFEKPPETAKPAEKAPEPKAAPKLEDFNTVEEYVAAAVAHGVETTLAETNRKAAEATQRAKAETKAREVQDMLAKTFDHGRKKYADFDDTALDPDLPILEGSTLDRWLVADGMTNDMRAEIMYHYGTHREELAELNKLPSSIAVRRLAALEATFSGNGKQPEKTSQTEKESESRSAAGGKKLTQAPPPGSEVGTHGSPTDDPRAKAIATGDVAAYMEQENRRELAKHSRK